MSDHVKHEIKMEVPYTEKISRLFIFRALWVYVLIWPLLVYALWVGLVGFVHFWHMLILGRRHKYMWVQKTRLFCFVTNWGSYVSYLTDKRPGFWPKNDL